MNCNPLLPVASTCVEYMFAPGFLNYALASSSCGTQSWVLGFGNTAAGPFPAQTECQTFIAHPDFVDFFDVRDSCGKVRRMVGFGPAAGVTTAQAMVSAILADSVALCALLQRIPLLHPSNSIVYATNAAGQCGIAENDAVTNWAL